MLLFDNLQKHLKNKHNLRYRELKASKSKYSKRTEFFVDFEWVPDGEVTKKHQKVGVQMSSNEPIQSIAEAEEEKIP